MYVRLMESECDAHALSDMTVLACECAVNTPMYVAIRGLTTII